MPPRYEHGGPSQYRVSFGGPITPAVRALIIINVAVFLMELVVAGTGGEAALGRMLEWFALTPADVFTKLFIWQLVTYMFLHSPAGIWHILFNMLILWMLGSDVERAWGAKRFVRYYLITGIGGGLAHCLFWQPMTIGASGAVFSVIVAFAMLFPTRTILFMFIFPLTARQFALLLTAIELVSLGAFTPDGVARLAHLGGALTGFLLIRGFWDPRQIWYDVKWRLRRRRFRMISRQQDEQDRKQRDRDRFYPFH